MFYAIQATVSVESEEWSSSRTLPTFYLNSDVQGIVSPRHAATVALDVITSSMGEWLDTNDDDTVTVSMAVLAHGDSPTVDSFTLDARTGR